MTILIGISTTKILITYDLDCLLNVYNGLKCIPMEFCDFSFNAKNICMNLAQSGVNLAQSGVSLAQSSVSLAQSGVNIPHNLNVFITSGADQFINVNSSVLGCDPASKLPHSGDFTYNRFMESCDRMASRIVRAKYSTSNAVDISSANGDLVWRNPNNSNTDHWAHLALLAWAYFNNKLALFIALLFMFAQNLSGNKFTVYLFLLILQASRVSAANIILANKLIAGIGWLFYANFMTYYDIKYKNIKSDHVNHTLFEDGKINYKLLRGRALLGVLFAFVINTGVLFSSSFAYATIPYLNTRHRIIAVFASYFVSALASTAWIYAARTNILGYGWRAVMLSYLRGFSESIAFNFLSYANFIIWEWLPQRSITYVITFVIGLICYCALAYFQIIMETGLEHRFLYGLLYDYIFTCLSMSSSGLYFLMGVVNMNLAKKIAIMLLCQIIVCMLPLEVYRFLPGTIRLGVIPNNNRLLVLLFGTDRANNPIFRRWISVLYQLTVFFAFAIGTFIWLDLTNLPR